MSKLLRAKSFNAEIASCVKIDAPAKSRVGLVGGVVVGAVVVSVFIT